MELAYSFAILIIIATVFYYINNRFLKFPTTIGIMVITMVFSLLLLVIGTFETEPLKDIYAVLNHIDFTKLLMGGMLYFLLFAGAIQIKLSDLKEEKVPVIVFSSLSVVISTFAVGFGLYYSLLWLSSFTATNMQIPLIYCLLFGSLISPTDPVAVLGILKDAHVAKSLEMKITGESLFNDGVAVITFSLLFSIAQGTEKVADITALSLSWLLVKEVFGAILVGLALGYIAFYAMKTAFDYKLSILITLSVVICGYMASQLMGISGPLTMVSAGLVIGNTGREFSQKNHLDMSFMKIFWELMDEILNAVLFLLIGFEVLLIPDIRSYWIPGLIAVVIVLVSRYISIKIPTLIIPFKEKFTRATFLILVWGGLRGGVSIALALSIGNSPHRPVIIACTYIVVVFSIVVQGLTVGKLAQKLGASG